MKNLIEKAFSYMPAYVLTLATIFSSPKKFFAARQLESDTEWTEALLFGAVSCVIFTSVIAWTGTQALDLWTYGAQSAISVLFGVALTALTIQLSWRLVGGKANQRSFFIITSYQFAVVLVIFAAFQVFATGFVKALDPALFELAKRVATEHRSYTHEELVAHRKYFLILLAIYLVAFLTVFAWMFIAWGAYRQLTGLGKLRSLIAFLISSIVSIPVGLLVYYFTVGFVG